MVAFLRSLFGWKRRDEAHLKEFRAPKESYSQAYLDRQNRKHRNETVHAGRQAKESRLNDQPSD